MEFLAEGTGADTAGITVATDEPQVQLNETSMNPTVSTAAVGSTALISDSTGLLQLKTPLVSLPSAALDLQRRTQKATLVFSGFMKQALSNMEDRIDKVLDIQVASGSSLPAVDSLFLVTHCRFRP